MKAPLLAAFRDSAGRRATLAHEHLVASRLGRLDRPRSRGSLYGAELTAVPCDPPNGAR